MDNNELRRQIFAVNKNIRFVGLIDKTGKIIEGGMREGLEAIDDEIHRKRWFNQVAIRAEMNEMFNKIYGKTQMVYVERERIKQLTFYRPNNTVFVTLQPYVDGHEAIDIGYSIAKILNYDK